ncbi:MAG TPA: response regulator transcription factor [Atribacteraceae bacterium]|nr:response regulator transcription factor [Atribacteraceae bacterium]
MNPIPDFLLPDSCGRTLQPPIKTSYKPQNHSNFRLFANPFSRGGRFDPIGTFQYAWHGSDRQEEERKKAGKKRKIRLVLIDDNKIFLESLVFILHLKKDMEVVGTSQRAHGTLALIENTQPDVVILDLMLPDMDGITLLGKIKERYPALPVIIFSVYEDFRKKALHRGAYAYLVKGSHLDEVYQAIRRAHENSAGSGG